MDEIQIKANTIIAEAIVKIIEKEQKKAQKERAKINSAQISYKGETYKSYQDILDAYACDYFSQSVCDRLLSRLDKARANADPNCMTDTEMLVLELEKHKNNLLHDIAFDKEMKKRKAEHEERMKELTGQGYSIREAETIIGNEERMRYE